MLFDAVAQGCNPGTKCLLFLCFTGFSTGFFQSLETPVVIGWQPEALRVCQVRGTISTALFQRSSLLCQQDWANFPLGFIGSNWKFTRAKCIGFLWLAQTRAVALSVTPRHTRREVNTWKQVTAPACRGLLGHLSAFSNLFTTLTRDLTQALKLH